MKVYDKAMWQIDGGIEKQKVISHFQQLFTWLNSKNLLTKKGRELLSIGIDSEIYLGDDLVNEDGKKFLDTYYESIVTIGRYSSVEDLNLLNKFYQK